MKLDIHTGLNPPVFLLQTEILLEGSPILDLLIFMTSILFVILGAYIIWKIKSVFFIKR